MNLRPERLRELTAAIFQAAVDSSLRIERDVFRRKPSAGVQSLYASEARVALKLSSKWWCCGRRPRDGRDGHRPEEEIEK